MSTTLTTSAEEIRLEMRRRFDAVNEAAQKGRQARRDSDAIRETAENNRWSKRDVDADDVAEMGENDSLGG
jgi:hypothetical protein